MAGSADGRLTTRGLGSDALGKILILSLLAGMTLARTLLAAAIPLTDDEAYYRLWGLAPALSYLDHPPMVGWMIAAGRAVAGETALGVRAMAVLASVIGALALWRTARLLFGVEAGRVAVLFATVMPLLCVGAIVITPDTPSVLFYILSAWALAELRASENGNWWLAVGLFAGLGLLSKYTNLFLGVSLLAWLVATPANRRWWRHWQLYAGGLIAVIVFLPVPIWNLAHDGASFTKQFGRVVDIGGHKLSWQFELWGALILLAGPVIVWLAASGLVLSAGRLAKQRDDAALLLLCMPAPLLLYFFAHAFHGRVNANWLAPVYPFLAIAAAVGLGRLSDARQRSRTALVAASVSGAIAALVYAHALHPLYLDGNRKEPTQQLRGWPDLAQRVAETARASGARWIATTSYATTGQLAFQLDGAIPVVQLDERLRYVHLRQPDPATLEAPALYVELERRARPDLLRERFRTVTDLGVLERGERGHVLARYRVHLVDGGIRPVLGPAGRAPGSPTRP